MNKLFISGLLFIFAITPYSLKAQQSSVPRVDSVALHILDKVSAGIQNLNSCSFRTTAYYDVWVDGLGYVKHSNVSEVAMAFPNKIKVHTTGDKGTHSIWYNGSIFTYYTKKNNQYSQFKFEGTIIQVIDSVNNSYGIEFPAADFFYPGFVSDLLNTGGNLIYVGTTPVDDKMCYHIAGNDINGTVFQFWITDDESWLPCKMSISYKEDSGSAQYEAIYSGWIINSDIPPAMFNFETPPSSNKVKLVKTSSYENL